MYGLICEHVAHARHATNSQAHLRMDRFSGKPDPFFLKITFITLLNGGKTSKKKILQPETEDLNEQIQTFLIFTTILKIGL